MARAVLLQPGMTPALRLVLLPLLFALLFSSPAAARRHPRPEKRSSPAEMELHRCQELAGRGGVDGKALDALSRAARIESVRLSGASTLSDEMLWDLVGGPPSPPLTAEVATALVARFAQSGLFASVDPRLSDGQLEIALREEPQVRDVQLRGLSEFRPEDLLDQLLQAPGRNADSLRRARASECPAPAPPPGWLARLENGEVRSGILHGGLRGALGRLLRQLRSKGYPLARVSGELTPAGDLLIDVDEGHVAGVEVRGVDPSLVRDVQAELGIRRGDVFTSGDLYSALDRIRRRWPFLHADSRGARPPPAHVLRVDDLPDGGARFRSDPPFESRPAARPAEDDDGGEDDFIDDLDERQERQRGQYPHFNWFGGRASAWYGFEADKLVVYLRSERSSATVHWEELFRHTPVTGFAPGLAGTWTIWDPGDRAHLLLDGAVNLNTRRPNLDGVGGTYLQRLNAKERVDWLLGARLRIPSLDIAELGGQIHALTDTADRWRMSSIDSYVYSALINRADREYYRRSGYAGFLTLHILEELTLGGEYRLDQYGALAPPSGVWTFFNRDDPRYGSARVEEGEMGSALFRLEYNSEKVPLHKVGSIWRNSETALAERRPWAIGLRTLNTFEVADRSLGGVFDFKKVVSDSTISLETGRRQSISLRLRGAGGRDLPAQKEEALGGWTALRGYDFKEFRGNASLLGTLQLEGRHFGAFLDVGSVHTGPSGWMDPKSSAGAMFSFADGSTRAEAAWRLDGRAKALPDFRILFSVPR